MDHHETGPGEEVWTDGSAGEYRSEEFSEVVSKEEVDPDTVVPVWDSKGRMTMRPNQCRRIEAQSCRETMTEPSRITRVTCWESGSTVWWQKMQMEML